MSRRFEASAESRPSISRTVALILFLVMGNLSRLQVPHTTPHLTGCSIDLFLFPITSMDHGDGQPGLGLVPRTCHPWPSLFGPLDWITLGSGHLFAVMGLASEPLLAFKASGHGPPTAHTLGISYDGF